VRLDPRVDARLALQALRSRRDVESAELDRLCPPESIADDPRFKDEWYLNRIDAPEAWDVTTGSGDVTIAILDTGVDGTHPDLAGKTVPGWNFYNENDDTRDVEGHGTMVAGVAAASSNNGIGVTSVAWGCRIMPIRVTDAVGNAAWSRVAHGLV